MKKVEEVRFWLDQDLPPKAVAKQVRCALSLVYAVKRLSGMAGMRHEIGVLKEELLELRERVAQLENGPAQTPPILSRTRNR
jgi:hypothetical protein